VTGAVCAIVAGLVQSSTMAGAHGGGSLVTRSSPTTSSRPPLASCSLQLCRAAVGGGVR
jgi:hypothetical protein